MGDAGLLQRQTMRDIASAIREKGGASGSLLPSEMAQAIMSISGGGSVDDPTRAYFAGLKTCTYAGTSSEIGIYSGNSGIKTAVFPVLESVTGGYAFQNFFRNCANLESASFPALQTVSGNAAFENVFNSCVKLTDVSFPILRSLSGTRTFGSIFFGCSSLESVEFPSLESLAGANTIRKIFQNCQSVASVSFPSLNSIESNSLIDAFADSYLTEAHFPASMESTIKSASSYGSNFGRGAGNMTIYFDL